MVREFKLPDVGEGLTEAEIVNWLVEVGDTVHEDQPVAEVETDKAVVEVPSPVNGTVKEILAEEGEMVPVGEVIITFDVEGEEPEPEAEATAEGAESTDVEEPEAAGEESETAEAASATKGGRTFAAPSARRLARELDVDIAAVEGSGPGGRVTEQDVRAAAEEEEAEEAEEAVEEPEVESATRRITEKAEAEETRKPAEAAGRERTMAAPATRSLAEELGVDIDEVPASEEKEGEPFVTQEDVRAYAEAKEAEAEAAEAEAEATEVEPAVTEAEAEAEAEAAPEREERVPYKGIRRTIGKAMETSKYTAPHVTHHDEVDVTELVEVRSRLKATAEEKGVKLTYLPFVMKAVIAGLKEYPILNSELDEENEAIIKKHYYNIGVATATDAGLMVPVVKDADEKGLLDIAEEVNELSEKARDRSISRSEMQDGTFSITNFGAIGGEYATPIINYPETAILGLGAIKEKPRVVDGEVVPRKVLTLSLSIDHRVIDGAEAARFTNTLKRYLSTPELLLLE